MIHMSSACAVYAYQYTEERITLGTKGYGSRFVVRSFFHSFVRSFCSPRYREQRSPLRAS